MTKSWRDIARPIIADVIHRTGKGNMAELRKELFKAYPFGMRKYHPYKIWLDEIKVQLGTKKPKQVHHPKEQLRLFE